MKILSSKAHSIKKLENKFSPLYSKLLKIQDGYPSCTADLNHYFRF
jgi:hypothetical protein